MSDAKAAIYLGLISGTSVDAIDAALVAFGPAPKLLAACAHPYPLALREKILNLSLGAGRTTFDELGTLDVEIGENFAEAASALLAATGTAAHAVTAIGSHGQTLWHAPAGKHPFTLQLGDPNVIAERTGIDTIADFRRRDVAAGGQGAPLVPAFHAAFLRDALEDRAVLNLGGIANISLLPGKGVIRGFDTGPANTLLDLWVREHHGLPFDRDGAFAQSGRCHTRLLERMLLDPYFSRAAPKSTGRDYFNQAWLAKNLQGLEISPADTQATLLALTAQSVAHALRQEASGTRRLLVCGGGARNPVMFNAIVNALPGIAVEISDRYGLDADYVEAMAFAWLAKETLAGRPGNLPDVTGASGPRILGGIYRA